MSEVIIFDGLARFLLEQAEIGSREAVSWRKFKVGAALLASNGEQVRVFRAGNFKPDPRAQTLCAEKSALQLATNAGFTRVMALAVVGPVQADSHSGKATRTLHPCGICREMFREHEQAYHPLDHVPVITARIDDLRVSEAMHFADLFRLHNT